MPDESETSSPGNIPSEFRINHMAKAPELPPVSMEPDMNLINADKNKSDLQIKMDSTFLDYRAAIQAAADQIKSGKFDEESDVYESIKEQRRGGFLWRRKIDHHTGGKWVNDKESEITKYSRLDIDSTFGENINYKMLLVKNGEQPPKDDDQPHSFPELSVSDNRYSNMIRLNWNQENAKPLQTVFVERPEMTELIALAEQLGNGTDALRYQISLELRKSPFGVKLLVSQEDQITQAEQELQSRYDIVSAWDTDSGDGSSISMMRKRDDELAKIEIFLNPLKEKRFHDIEYAFDPNSNVFFGTPKNTDAHPDQIDVPGLVNVTKGLLSIIPTDTRKSVLEGAPPVVTLALPGEKTN